MTPFLQPVVLKHDYYISDLGRFHRWNRREEILRASRMEQKIEEDEGFPANSQSLQPLLDTIAALEGDVFLKVCEYLSRAQPNAMNAIKAQYGNLRTLSCQGLMITYAVMEREMYNLILLLALDHPDLPRSKPI